MPGGLELGKKYVAENKFRKRQAYVGIIQKTRLTKVDKEVIRELCGSKWVQ